MFAKETYTTRRNSLKKSLGTGLLLFLGNEESGMNYEDNTYHFRQDSTFLYFFGLPYAGLAAIIDVDEDKEIIFGDELTMDHIVWMGIQPALCEKAQRVGVTETRPAADLKKYLEKAVAKRQVIHYLPVYRAEHRLKLLDWLDIKLGMEQPSVPFIRGVVNMRNYKTAEELVEIERACNVTADMHITAMKVLRIGMKEWEVVAALEAVAQGLRACFSLVRVGKPAFQAGLQQPQGLGVMVFDPSARHLAAAHGAAIHGHAAPAISGSVRGDLTAGKVLRYPRVGKGQCFAVGAERAECREQVVLRHEASLLHAAHEHPRPQDMQSRLRKGHRQQNAAAMHHGRAVRQRREILPGKLQIGRAHV